MRTQQRTPLRRVLASVVSGALVAAAAVVGVAAPASAIEADVTSSSLSWGLRETFRDYVINQVTTDGSITTVGNASQPGGGMNPFEWSAGVGSFDTENSAVDVSYTGGVHFVKHGGELDITFANPRIDFDGATGTLYLDVQAAAFGQNPAVSETGVAFASLSGGTLSTNDVAATYSGISTTLTEAGAAAFSGFYGAGEALDPLTITAPFAVPEPAATTTSLAVTPEGTAAEGAEVTLAASVSPSAPGSVEFFDGSTSLGTREVVDGSAALTSTQFVAGSHSLSAAFTPADAGAYAASTSAALPYTITAVVEEPDPAVATTTNISVAPQSRALLGQQVELSAVVAASSVDELPIGSVEFFQTPAGGSDAVSLGSTTLAEGVATLSTDALSAGGHTFTAVYQPEAGFEASSSEQTGNYGIVDTSEPAGYEPGPDAVVASEDATASWAWSAYADGWTKHATGDVSVVDGDFRFSGGEVVADAGGAMISFTGTLRVEAYAAFFPPNGQWVELVDPALHLTSEGSGVWVAGVATGAGSYTQDADAERLVVGTFSDVADLQQGTVVEREVALDYEGATAQGTWNADYANAWPNAFVLKVPSAIQSFYYQTGESPGNLTKPPSPLAIAFEWPEAPAEEPVDPGEPVDPEEPVEPEEPATVSGATLEWGLKQSFRTYVTGPIAGGEISLSDVAQDAAGGFVWSNGAGEYDESSATGEVSYDGSVRFTGHGGLLDMTISNPRIQVTSADAATLYLDVVSRGLDGSSVDEDGVAFAALSLPEGIVAGDEISWSSAAAELTEAGAAAFAGFYSAGTELDPVTFAFPLIADAPSQPVLSLGSSSIAQGGTLTVTGSGFAPNERVTATVYSEPVQLGAFTATGAGVITVRWAIPADFETGAHTLEITRADGSTVSTAFTVTAAAASGELPASGPTGDEVAEVCLAQSVGGATISWGVRSSFRDYITGPIADGSISGGWGVGSGAYSTENSSGRVSYGGSIHYTGHNGILDITLSNPVIQVNSASSATLFLSANGSRIAFATLSLPASSMAGGAISWSNAPATLTSAGAQVFSYNGNEFYPAGSALDPVSFTFPLGAEVPCDSTTDGTLAATGGGSSPDAAWIGGLLLALGAATLVLVRRRRIAGVTIRR